MYIVAVKPCEAPVCLCTFYRPAHHTERNQLSHLHVHGCPHRCTVLCYTVIPIYARMFFLNRRTVLLLYTSTVIHYIWAKIKNILFHNPRVCHRRFMNNKKVRSVVLLLLLVLMMLVYHHHHHPHSHQHHQH
jgi:hypothetical protein